MRAAADGYSVVQRGEEGAVCEWLLGFEGDGPADAPQDVGLLLAGLAEHRIAVQATVPQHQHPGADRAEHAAGERHLAGCTRVDQQIAQDVRADFDQPDQLRLGPRPSPRGAVLEGGARASKRLGVLGRVGQIEGRAIDRHQPQSTQKRARQILRSDRPGQSTEQQEERAWPEPPTCLTQGRLHWGLPPSPPLRIILPQPIDQVLEHIDQPLTCPQPQPDHKRHHQVGRQHPLPSLLRSRFRVHRIDRLIWDPQTHRLQHPLIAQMLPRPHLHQRKPLHWHPDPSSNVPECCRTL